MRFKLLILRRIGSTFLSLAQTRSMKLLGSPAKIFLDLEGHAKSSMAWEGRQVFFLGRGALLKCVFYYRIRMTCKAVFKYSFCQYLNPSHLFTRNLLHYYCLLWTSVTEIWKLPKICSAKQHPEARRKGGRQRRGGKCQASFAKQIEYYPFV